MNWLVFFVRLSLVAIPAAASIRSSKGDDGAENYFNLDSGADDTETDNGDTAAYDSDRTDAEPRKHYANAKDSASMVMDRRTGEEIDKTVWRLFNFVRAGGEKGWELSKAVGSRMYRAYDHVKEHGPGYWETARDTYHRGAERYHAAKKKTEDYYQFLRGALEAVAPIYVGGKAMLLSYWDSWHPTLTLCGQQVVVFGREKINAVLFGVKPLDDALNSGEIAPLPVSKVDDNTFKLVGSSATLTRIENFVDEEYRLETVVYQSNEDPPQIYIVMEVDGRFGLGAYPYKTFRNKIDLLEVRETPSGENVLVKLQPVAPPFKDPAAAAPPAAEQVEAPPEAGKPTEIVTPRRTRRSRRKPSRFSKETKNKAGAAKKAHSLSRASGAPERPKTRSAASVKKRPPPEPVQKRSTVKKTSSSTKIQQAKPATLAKKPPPKPVQKKDTAKKTTATTTSVSGRTKKGQPQIKPTPSSNTPRRKKK